MLISSFATLVTSKTLIPSSRTPYLAVEKHFFQECMAPTLERIRVDDFWYLDTYQDVAEAMRMGLVASAKDHYVRFGYFENRLPCNIVADDKWYLNVYPDVNDAIKRNQFPSAQEHFIAVGYAEGRLPYANFQLPLD